jgi:hypothetical protein
MRDREVYVIEEEDIKLPLDGVLGVPQQKKGRERRRRKSTTTTKGFGTETGRPRLAASFSLVMSGSGHFLHREWRLGLLYFLALGFTVAFHYFLHNAWGHLRTLVERIGLSEADLLIGVILVDLYLLLVLLSGVFSAFRIGRAYSAEDEDPSPNPLLPALASLLIPGWGQIVNGQIQKALVFLFVFFTELLAVGLWLCLRDPVERMVLGGGDPLQTLFVGFALATYGLVGWSLSLYDAVLVARYRRTMVL